MHLATGSVKSLNGKYNSPTGLAIDSTGSNLYIVDSGSKSVKRLAITTGIVTTLPGNYSRPTGVANDYFTDSLYVTDTKGNVVKRLSLKTGIQDKIPGKFSSPTGITIDMLGVYVYICDTGTNTIKKFQILKRRVFTFFEGVSSPTGIVIDPTGDFIYVSSAISGLIIKVSVKSPSVSNVITVSSGVGSSVSGLATHPSGDCLYIVDSNNNRIKKFEEFPDDVIKYDTKPNIMITKGNDTHSTSFVLSQRRTGAGDKEFVCPTLKCTDKILADSYLHVVAGVYHKSSFPLLVNRICECLQLCMSPRNLIVSLHNDKDLGYSLRKLKHFSSFLSALGVQAPVWKGNFTANFKMVHYLERFKAITDPNKYIFHIDLDEFPDLDEMRMAVKELYNGSCDAVRAVWIERVASDGSLTDPKLFSGISLKDQYPMDCSISKNFMPVKTTFKALIHRANLRLVSGQHSIWCEPQDGVEYNATNPWNHTEACITHVGKRMDKSTTDNHILSLIPKYQRSPVYCQKNVSLFHFKYISGVITHLQTRAKNYKEANIGWWKQSAKLDLSIEANNGTICITCPENECRPSKRDGVAF